jgi:hypothetical protein
MVRGAHPTRICPHMKYCLAGAPPPVPANLKWGRWPGAPTTRNPAQANPGGSLNGFFHNNMLDLSETFIRRLRIADWILY